MTHAIRALAPPLSAPLAPLYMTMTLRLRRTCPLDLTDHVALLRHAVALAQKTCGLDVQAAVVLPREVRLLCRGARFEDQFIRAARQVAASASHHAGDAGAIDWQPPDLTGVPPHRLDAERSALEDAPVRAGLVTRAEDWPYSSVHRRRRALPILGAGLA